MKDRIRVFGAFLGLVLSLIYLLICLGCAGSGSYEKRYSVSHGDLSSIGAFSGYIVYSRGVIVVEETTPESSWVNVIKAELMHAGGVAVEPVPYTTWNHFSPEAVENVSQTSFPVYLYPSERLYGATLEAAAWWNGALGWDRYQVFR